jgi:hypothetical protein
MVFLHSHSASELRTFSRHRSARRPGSLDR